MTDLQIIQTLKASGMSQAEIDDFSSFIPLMNHEERSDLIQSIASIQTS